MSIHTAPSHLFRENQRLEAENSRLRRLVRELAGRVYPLEDALPGLALRPHEARVLACLAAHAGYVVSHEQLMTALYWDARGDHADRDIIKTFVHRIRGKLAEGGYPARIETVWGVGYRLVLGEGVA